MKINGNEIRQGYIIEYQGKLWRVVKAQQVQMGNWRSYWQAELKDIKAGTKLNERFGSSDVVERVRLDEKDYQYLYKEGDLYTFMDNETYDQLHVPAESVGNAVNFLKEGDTAVLPTYNTEIIGVDLPASVELEVADTEPGIQGDRVSGARKPATLETGYVVQVPLFVNVGDRLKVDTRTGEYLSRA